MLGERKGFSIWVLHGLVLQAVSCRSTFTQEGCIVESLSQDAISWLEAEKSWDLLDITGVFNVLNLLSCQELSSWPPKTLRCGWDRNFLLGFQNDFFYSKLPGEAVGKVSFRPFFTILSECKSNGDWFLGRRRIWESTKLKLNANTQVAKIHEN